MNGANKQLNPLIFPVKTCLEDGTPLLIRQLNPRDKQLLQTGLSQLSEQDRYFRFLQPMPRLSEDMLRRFTELDHVDHEAVGAIDLSTPSAKPVGVARYVRSDENPEVGEIAITVLDTHKKRGLGTLLLAMLAKRACDNEIRFFDAVVASNNQRMLSFVDRFNPVNKTVEDQTLRIRIPLYEDACDYPATPVGKVHRQVAKIALKAA